jgi:hypothetical protein
VTSHTSGVNSTIKKLGALVAALMLTFSASGQIDSVPDARLDSMDYEQLQQFYTNETDPPYQFKGASVGDSVYGLLNELTSPTNTVDAPSLFRDLYEAPLAGTDSFDFAMQKYKPKISLGMGRLAFHGDIYAKGKHFQGPMVGRMGYNLGISQRLTRFLQLDFSAMFGKLGANENLENRHENFVSEIRSGGVSLLYDFGNFIPDAYKIRPFVSIGVSGFEFLSKTDLKDQNGNTYYYWSDGSIRAVAESAPAAQDARHLTRDYHYESDIRELNRDGYGKYAERAWAVPLGAGAIMKITDRMDLKLNFQYWFSTTDFIDGIAAGGEGARKGTKQKDNFTYTSFSLQWDLMTNKKPRRKSLPDTLANEVWLADNVDSDRDGVRDFDDNCQGTPDSVKVNAQGCPLDDDNDGIPNYRDDELASAPDAAVNGKGVTQDDAYWAAWYAQYRNDTTGGEPLIEVVSNYYLAKTTKKKKKKDGRTYTVELVRYSGSIPSDELAFLLSIGDITSSTLADGTTVVYTSGNYEKLSTAVKRRDEFRAQGNKDAGISTVNGTDIVKLRDDELDQLLEAELSDLANMNIDSSTVENFSSSDIVYRVQLGAFKNRISTSVFNTNAGVLELKTGESVFRYVTKGFRTIEEAAAMRADLVVQGYSDAFVTAYKDGKRIPLNQTKATVAKGFEEDLTEDKMFSSVDKSLIAFRVQLGPLKKKAQEESMDARTKGLTNLDKQTTATGSIRYITGEFKTLAEAEKYRKSLEEKGFTDAFAIATFRGEIVSIQEAQELLK